jgi:hypothetical protein
MLAVSSSQFDPKRRCCLATIANHSEKADVVPLFATVTNGTQAGKWASSHDRIIFRQILFKL